MRRFRIVSICWDHAVHRLLNKVGDVLQESFISRAARFASASVNRIRDRGRCDSALVRDNFYGSASELALEGVFDFQRVGEIFIHGVASL